MVLNGAGTNMKVGGGHRSGAKVGAPIQRTAPEKKTTFLVVPSTFWL